MNKRRRASRTTDNKTYKLQWKTATIRNCDYCDFCPRRQCKVKDAPYYRSWKKFRKQQYKHQR